MTLFKKTLPLLVGFLLIGSTAFAQKNKQGSSKNVTKKELKAFSHVATKAQTINRKLRQQAQKQINESDLSLQRYREIAVSKMNPKTDTLDLTKQEQSEYQKLHAKLTSLQKKMQSKLKAEVKKRGSPGNDFSRLRWHYVRIKNCSSDFEK